MRGRPGLQIQESIRTTAIISRRAPWQKLTKPAFEQLALRCLGEWHKATTEEGGKGASVPILRAIPGWGAESYPEAWKCHSKQPVFNGVGSVGLWAVDLHQLLGSRNGQVLNVLETHKELHITAQVKWLQEVCQIRERMANSGQFPVQNANNTRFCGVENLSV